MKKLWISVKRGFIREPKHRLAVGECIWLFEYMLDVANWDDGVIGEWKDEAAADDMQMPIRTLREQRRKLAEAGYIVCIQKQYGQDIVIQNWTNPRSYSGETLNKKQGGSETEAEENGQGYTQGYTQGSTQDVTPTYDSKIKDHGSNEPTTIQDLPLDWQIASGQENIYIPDDFEARARDAANLLDMGCKGGGALAEEFMLSRHLIIPDSKIKGNRKAAREMLEMGVKPEHVTQAVTDLTRKGMTITDLFSISKTAIDLANKANNAPVDRSFGL